MIINTLILMLGYNMKITDMQAACGLAQLDRLEGFIKKRKENFNFLYKNLKRFRGIFNITRARKKFRPILVWISIIIKKK
jgi:CDP-4-dehydro-6-deoxyglucose reductase, E1